MADSTLSDRSPWRYASVSMARPDAQLAHATSAAVDPLVLPMKSPTISASCTAAPAPPQTRSMQLDATSPIPWQGGQRSPQGRRLPRTQLAGS